MLNSQYINSNIAVLDGFSSTPWLWVRVSVQPLSSLVPYLTVMRGVVETWYSAEAVFSSPLEQRSSLSKRSLSRFSEVRSINSNISPESESRSSVCLYTFSAIIEVRMSLSPNCLVHVDIMVKNSASFYFRPNAFSFCVLVPAVSKLLKRPDVSDALCFHWQLISIKWRFGFWFISWISSITLFR